MSSFTLQGGGSISLAPVITCDTGSLSPPPPPRKQDCFLGATYMVKNRWENGMMAEVRCEAGSRAGWSRWSSRTKTPSAYSTPRTPSSRSPEHSLATARRSIWLWACRAHPQSVRLRVSRVGRPVAGHLPSRPGPLLPRLAPPPTKEPVICEADSPPDLHRLHPPRPSATTASAHCSCKASAATVAAPAPATSTLPPPPWQALSLKPVARPQPAALDAQAPQNGRRFAGSSARRVGADASRRCSIGTRRHSSNGWNARALEARALGDPRAWLDGGNS